MVFFTILNAGKNFPGLPKRDNWSHTAEIADVALDLVYHASGLQVPHKKHMKIKIRVGIHTGKGLVQSVPVGLLVNRIKTR